MAHGRASRWILGTAAAAAALAAPGTASADSSSVAAYWALEAGAGQLIRDASGNGNHGVRGTTTASETSDPAWIAGPRDSHALRFGGDDFVTVRDSSTLEPQEITVGATVRAARSPGSYRYVVSKGAIRCETASYGLYTGVGGGLHFYVSDGAGYALSPDAGRAVWDGRWHLIAGSFDGTTVRLYVDGRQIGTGTPTSISLGYGLPVDDRLYIGDYKGECEDPHGFVGDVGAVGILNRAVGQS